MPQRALAPAAHKRGSRASEHVRKRFAHHVGRKHFVFVLPILIVKNHYRASQPFFPTNSHDSQLHLSSFTG
jgi:hypothetical protein